MDSSINRLTERQVRDAQEGRHADGGYLFLVVRGASKSWVVRGPRTNGKRIEAGLGSVDQVSIAHARRKRDELLAQVRDGLNPIEEKRKARQAEERRKTFAQAAEAVIATRSSGWRVSFEGRSSTATQWEKDMAVDCAPIADRFVDEIAIEDIKAIVAPYWDRGHLDRARALLSRIERVMNFAKAHGWRTSDNPASWAVFQHISPQAPRGDDPHHAAIDWRAAPELMGRLRASTAVGARLVEFIILTAARSGEARGALWSEVDFDKRVWTVPGSRMKKGKEHAVPLSDQAIELLRRMEAERVGEFVFPGGRGEIAQAADRPMRNASLWALVQRTVGGGEATTHGFRSAFKDWCNNQGIEHQLSERALAHDIGDATVTAYARETLTEKRRPVMEAWGAFLGGVPRDNVVPLKRVA
jgi:integrase